MSRMGPEMGSLPGQPDIVGGQVGHSLVLRGSRVGELVDALHRQ